MSTPLKLDVPVFENKLAPGLNQKDKPLNSHFPPIGPPITKAVFA